MQSQKQVDDDKSQISMDVLNTAASQMVKMKLADLKLSKESIKDNFFRPQNQIQTGLHKMKFNLKSEPNSTVNLRNRYKHIQPRVDTRQGNQFKNGADDDSIEEKQKNLDISYLSSTNVSNNIFTNPV